MAGGTLQPLFCILTSESVGEMQVAPEQQHKVGWGLLGIIQSLVVSVECQAASESEDFGVLQNDIPLLYVGLVSRLIRDQYSNVDHIFLL